MRRSPVSKIFPLDRSRQYVGRDSEAYRAALDIGGIRFAIPPYGLMDAYAEKKEGKG